MPDVLTGGCNCGAVRFALDRPLIGASYCHCTRCQRRSGSAAGAGGTTAHGSFRLTAGEEHLGRWSPGDGWDKVFCARCGSGIFSQDPGDPAAVGVRLGAVDGDPGVRPGHHQFVAYAARWEPLPDDGLPRFAEGRPREPHERALAEAWARLGDEEDPARFHARIDAALEGVPPGDAVALFERGAAQDSTGFAQAAVPLYRAALDAGLRGERRRRAVIQLASSLRNLGDAQEAVDLLTAELDRDDHPQLQGAVRGFLALALADVGREREATAMALTALAGELPRYRTSLAAYAQDLAAGG